MLSKIDAQLDILYDAEEEISNGPGLPIPGSIEKEVDKPDCEGFLSEIDAELNILYDACEPQAEIGLLEIINAECLNSDVRSGRPQVLSEMEKDHLVAVAKRDWSTRHMTREDVQLEASLGHVGRSTVLRTLHSRGIKAYVEECKFILDENNKERRVVSLSIPLTGRLFMLVAACILI